FGNVLKEAAIGYGRRYPNDSLPTDADRDNQARHLITYTEHRVAGKLVPENPVTDAIDTAFDYRAPLPCEARTYELTGVDPEENAPHFSFEQILRDAAEATPLDYEKEPTPGQKQKRTIEYVRTYFRRNDLTGSLLLGELQSLALPFESYRLASTPGLLEKVFK